MYRHVTFLLLCSLLTLFTTACTSKKKYFYKEGSREVVIKAYSDSAAYLEAFKKFEISRKVTSEIKKSMDNKYLTAPTIFQLLNEKREDITYKVSFSSQDSLKAKISKRVNELPNVMQKPVEKNRQESDGK